MALVSVTSLLAADAGKGAEPTVTICLTIDRDMPSNARPIVDRAQIVAREIFNRAGVRTKWHGDPRFCTAKPAMAILISLSENTPQNELPGALASAQLFEGVHIRVFFDRVDRVP